MKHANNFLYLVKKMFPFLMLENELEQVTLTSVSNHLSYRNFFLDGHENRAKVAGPGTVIARLGGKCCLSILIVAIRNRECFHIFTSAAAD